MTHTLNERPVRYDSNQECALPEMPILDSMDRRMRWLTVSNAADKSSRIVEAIVLSYKSLSLDPPEKLHAHSTRGVSSSWALLKGVSVEDIGKAASWSSRHTFIRFYMLDVAEPSFLHSVLRASDL